MDGLLPTELGLLAALALAAVLATAGVSKLGRPEATAADFEAMDLPRPDILAVAVPAVEVGCAALLVVVPGWGGVAAFGLLAIFTAQLVAIVGSGRSVSCACFGARSRAPVSIRHLRRNAGLLLLALAAATTVGPIWNLGSG